MVVGRSLQIRRSALNLSLGRERQLASLGYPHAAVRTLLAAGQLSANAATV